MFLLVSDKKNILMGNELEDDFLQFHDLLSAYYLGSNAQFFINDKNSLVLQCEASSLLKKAQEVMPDFIREIDLDKVYIDGVFQGNIFKG